MSSFEFADLKSNDLYFESVVEIASQHQSASFNWDRSKLLSEWKHADVLGCLEHGNVIGFVFCKRLAPDQIEFTALATRKACEGRGVMKSLIEHIAAKHKEDELLLEVHADNLRALGLYKDLGFVEVGRRKKYYSDGGDAILFRR